MFKDYTVVCDDRDKAVWLEARRSYLTASAVSTWLGHTAKFICPDTGRPKDKDWLIATKKNPNYADFHDSQAAWWGRFHEEINRKAFSKITGVRTRGTHLFLASTEIPVIGCTLDGLVIAPEAVGDFGENRVALDRPEHFKKEIQKAIEHPRRVGLIEMKETNIFGKKTWKSANPPEYYWVQCQTQMFVSGYDWCFLVGQVGVRNQEMFFIEKDEDFVYTLETIATEFQEAMNA